MIGPKKLEKISEEASKAFWKSVVEQLPGLNPDNLDFGTVVTLQWQMKEAIERFISGNVISVAGLEDEPEPNGDKKPEGRLPCKECRKQQFHERGCSLDTEDGLITPEQRG